MIKKNFGYFLLSFLTMDELQNHRERRNYYYSTIRLFQSVLSTLGLLLVEGGGGGLQ
jgi:hypothetical protein